MPELLLFAWDHSVQSVPTPSTGQLAALPKRYDVIAVQPDGWRWGAQELVHPWFRVLAWSGSVSSDMRTLLSPLLAGVDIDLNPTTYRQYRGFYLDLTNALVPQSIQTWFADGTRAVPRLELTGEVARSLTVAAVRKARPPIAIPLGAIPGLGA
jgi:hypothetical protein